MQKEIKYSVVGLLVLFMFACSSTKETKTTPDPAPVVLETPAPPPPPPMPSVDDKFGVDSIKTITNYSLYRGYYKYCEFAEALPYWRYVFQSAPKVRKQLYKDGEKMYQDFMSGKRVGAICGDGSETDATCKGACKEAGKVSQWQYINAPTPQQRAAIFDTLFMIYDQRIEHFGEEGIVATLKARSMLKYKPEETTAILELRKKVIDIEGEDAPYDIVQYYAMDITQQFNDKKISEEQATDELTRLSEIATYNVEQDNKAAQYEQVGNMIDSFIDKIEGATAKSCPEIVSYYEPKFRSNPDDLKQTQLIYKKLRRAKCSKEPFFFEVLMKMNELEPTASRYRIIAQLYLRKNELQLARQAYESSIGLENDDAKKAQTHLKIAKIHSMQNNYSEARKSAYKAASFNPRWAEPYILIGDLYRSSGGSCKDDGINGASREWVAADKYQKALSVDPDSREAKSKYNKAKSRFPEKEIIFFSNKYELDGTSKIGCWINETTRVRVK